MCCSNEIVLQVHSKPVTLLRNLQGKPFTDDAILLFVALVDQSMCRVDIRRRIGRREFSIG
jgi:hypothetical protein